MGAAHLAVVTDGPAESQRRKVAALGLAPWVSEIVITSERGAGWAKPEVRSFEYLQGLFDVKPRECVYFGDNPTKDFAGAKLIGWQTVRVRRPGGLHFDAESQHDVDRVIDNFDDSHWGAGRDHEHLQWRRPTPDEADPGQLLHHLVPRLVFRLMMSDNIFDARRGAS